MTEPQLPPPPPSGFPPSAPGYPAPPGAYSVPMGGYSAPSGAYPGAPTAPGPVTTGVLALVLSLVAAVVTPVVVGVTGYQIGYAFPSVTDYVGSSSDSLAFLSPVRDQVLWAEIAFWVGTVLGVTAIVLGIIAIARRRGRGQGIAGLIIAVLGPMVFFTALTIALSLGASAGTAATFGA